MPEPARKVDCAAMTAMTATTADARAPDPTGSLAIVAPLLRVVARARGVLLVGLSAMVVALLALMLGAQGWATVLAVSGGAAALTALAGVLAARGVDREIRFDTKAMAQVLAQDPNPAVITDATGQSRAANRAAAAKPEPVQRLMGWSVDPAQTVEGLLSEVRRRGNATREFNRNTGMLHVFVHSAGGSGQAIVWRFLMRDRSAFRDLDSLALPIVSRGTEGVVANSAAQLMAGLATDPAILRTLDAGPPRHGAPTPVTLASGEVVQTLALTGLDGVEDLLVLPPSVVAADDARNAIPAHLSNFEEIPVALVEIDPQGGITGTNRLARALLALDPDETRYFWQAVEGLGRPVADWLADAQAGRALGRPEVLRACLTGGDTYVQIILRRAGGPEAQGHLVAVISDATELKSLEARFVQSQKMQAIGQLAGGIAHDFNNLLTAISGHCDLLLLNRDRFDPEHNDLLQIHQNANRAAALVRQLLAFSRKQTMKPEIIRLESLLEDLAHLLTRLVGERITLALSHDPALDAIRADRRQLEQVIMNLVVNARDAMPMGGTIRIETQLVQLQTELEQGRARIPPGDYALVRVIDEGVGIAADIIDKIFEPFFTTKRLGEGTGLGLSTAYGIVKQMGGYIFAQSVEGSGTVFTLYFGNVDQSTDALRDILAHERPTAALHSPSSDPGVPVATRPAPAPAPEVVAQQIGDERASAGLGTPPPGGAILLVEDEAPVRAFAARVLRLQGYQVFEAQDGEQALEFLGATAPPIDLFVTDVIMPGIDGPGWVAQALALRPGTPVVFVSGYTEDTVSAALSRIPRAVFLGKPFSLRELSDTIKAQLEH